MTIATGIRQPSASLEASFKEAMASVCAPVSVVTTAREGAPYGTTVSAFVSLSMSPPMLLVSLDRRSNLLSVVEETLRFGVNVLTSQQAGLAVTFAQKGGSEKFEGIEWQVDEGLPRLTGVGGFLSCAVERFVGAGDHVVVLGNVRGADTSRGLPLTYHNREFGTHAPGLSAWPPQRRAGRAAPG